MSVMDQLRSIEERMTKFTRIIHTRNLKEEPGKLEPKRYTTKEVESMVGRTYHTIRKAEQKGDIPEPKTNELGRREGYTLANINIARDHFGTRLRRSEMDEVITIAFQNFKGGSAKTTSATHCAEYLAEAGLRVLLIDCDPQGSSTKTFGYAPDDDIDASSTLLPLMEGDQEELTYAIRRTYWDGLDLVPANLELFEAEYTLAAEESRTVALQRLRWGVAGVNHNYDVIILDPAPSLGLLSLSVMYAANALIIPMPPAVYDLFSTRSFCTMMRHTAEKLEKYLGEIDYKFVKILMTRLDDSSDIQVQLSGMLPDILGNNVMRYPVRKTAALDRSGMHGRTVYEMRSDQVNRKTLKRALTHFNQANEEILELIRSSWPSQKKAMREAGKI